jgi:hypothetical protein
MNRSTDSLVRAVNFQLPTFNVTPPLEPRTCALMHRLFGSWPQWAVWNPGGSP